MATAETRRKETESRSPDGSPLNKGSQSRRSTRQLDFVQAMADFKLMFPTLDDEVIEAVLRANDGAVDATIDQLLTMTIDEDMTLVVPPEPLLQQIPQYNEFDLIAKSANAVVQSPPSYSEAMRSAGERDHPTSIWTTPIGIPPLPRINSLKLDEDTHMEPVGATAQVSPAGLLARAGLGSLPVRDLTDCAAAKTSVGDTSKCNSNTTQKKAYRNWNPPLLGNLPDDFLRLMPLVTDASTKTDTDNMAVFASAPVNVMSLSDVRPKIHKNRSKSEKVSRSASLNVKDPKSKSLEKKSKTSVESMSRSYSVADDSSRLSGVRYRDRSLNNAVSPTHHSVIIETHDFSKDMLQQRIKENERQRGRTSDPEMTQYLEDERLALAIQNSEFLQELRSNEDFMKTLERDHANAKRSETLKSSHPTIPSPPLPTEIPPLRPPDDAMEGYGDKDNATVGPFMFSQPINKDKDEDAELRKQLSGMGKASRRQMAALARKFFRRKKKSSKQILSEKLAPSMMNLLEDEDEEEDEDPLMDRRHESSPEIEPLTSSLVGVPSYRTVQRPPYKPDGVTTYFDNKNVDMV